MQRLFPVSSFPKVLVFDLDDTLFPEEQFVLSGFQAVDRCLQEKGHSGFFGMAATLFDRGVRGNIFDLSLAELKISTSRLLISDLIQVYRNHIPSLTLHKDAAWALNYFHGKAKIGLITDGYLETQRNKISALQIAPFFEAIIYSDEFGRDHWKPSATPYVKLVEALQCDHNECVYVSDNAQKDFITPNRLGWTTIQISREKGEYSKAIVAPEFEAQKKSLLFISWITCFHF